MSDRSESWISLTGSHKRQSEVDDYRNSQIKRPRIDSHNPPTTVPRSDSIELTIPAEVSTIPALPQRHDTPHFNGIRQASEVVSSNDTTRPGSPGNGESENGYEVCLGVINTMSNSSFSGTQAASITASIYSRMLKLNFQDSGKYAGILNSPVLCCLLQDFKVRFSAQLSPPDQDRGSEPKPNRGAPQLKSPNLCPVRIVIYAMRGDERAIGNKLSDAGLFLQHPTAHECMSQNVVYSNPHYLARPGSEPPTLEDLSLTSGDASPSQANRLDDVGMSRLLRIFDLAEPDGSGVSIRVDPSPRLSCTLMSHQLVALAMMIEKECGIVENPRFPSLWAPTADNRYRHSITGKRRDRPIPVYGGVLADEMGLGKTLSVLALICSSLDDHHHQESAGEQQSMVTGTLIITPKSTITEWQKQIDRHIFENQIKVGLYHGTERRQSASQLEHFDVVITTYETLRSDWEAEGPLLAHSWLRVVLDEAHRIRNRSSLAFKSAVALRAKYHWCLSGTPIHNSLDDYGALLAFVGVDPFHDKTTFDTWIAGPLQENPRTGIRRLKELVRATCLRRTKASPTVHLDLVEPIKKVEHVDLGSQDQALYDFFRKKTAEMAVMSRTAKQANGSTASQHNNILSCMNVLRLICNHGRALLPPQALTAWLDGSNAKADLRVGAAFQAGCSVCGVDLASPDDDDPTSPSPDARSCDSLCETCCGTNEALPKSRGPAKRQRAKKMAGVPASTQPSAKVEVSCQAHGTGHLCLVILLRAHPELYPAYIRRATLRIFDPDHQ